MQKDYEDSSNPLVLLLHSLVAHTVGITMAFPGSMFSAGAAPLVAGCFLSWCCSVIICPQVVDSV